MDQMNENMNHNGMIIDIVSTLNDVIFDDVKNYANENKSGIN